jgi:hypothetical protein
MVMTEKELIEFLKQNLKIVVEEPLIYDPYDTAQSIYIKLELNGETISQDGFRIASED